MEAKCIRSIGRTEDNRPIQCGQLCERSAACDPALGYAGDVWICPDHGYTWVQHIKDEPVELVDNTETKGEGKYAPTQDRVERALKLLDDWEQWAITEGEYERHMDRPDTAWRINELRIVLKGSI